MRIGINLLFLYEITGIGVYVKELCENIGKLDKKNRFFIFTSKNPPKEIFFSYPNFRYIRLPFDSNSKLIRIIFEQLILPFYLKKLKIDLLFNPSAFNPLIVFCKKITTLHDVGYLLDRSPTLKNLYLRFISHCAKNSEAIVTVSEFSKEEIGEVLNINQGKIRVIYEGVPHLEDVFPEEERALIEKLGINKPYFFYIGLIVPHKNIENILKAFRLFKLKHPEYRFVFAGRIVKELIDVEKLLTKCGFDKQEVNFIGKVSVKEKIALYKNSKALIFPSLHEGFGLPVLEAQSLGVPVLTSNISSLPEIAGDGALFIDPYNVKDVAQGMEKIAFDENLRKDLIKKGYENIKRFSWEKTAKELLEVFRSIR